MLDSETCSSPLCFLFICYLLRKHFIEHPQYTDADSCTGETTVNAIEEVPADVACVCVCVCVCEREREREREGEREGEKEKEREEIDNKEIKQIVE